MKKSYTVLLLLVFLVFFLSGITARAEYPDSPDDVIFVNTGKMNVGAGGTNHVALYVPYGMKHIGNNVEIVVNGEVDLGGNFYQDAQSPVFKVDPSSTTSELYSVGTVRFVKTYGGSRQVTSDNINTSYDRGENFIAFPHVLLATDDTISLAAKMGMDALTLKRQGNYTGALVLCSDRYTNNVYDASLRITGSGASSLLVDSGAVIVEREMSYYRSLSGSEKLFGFASPFKDTQLSGYYAGNWVRRPIADETTGHTQYIFGNEQDDQGVILPNQYVFRPLDKLVPAQAYMIRPRPAGFSYADLRNDKNGLMITDANLEIESYDQSKFRFNGKVYSIPAYKELLFAEDVLFESPYITGTSSTVNWLIGNSYTAPISVQKIIDAMAVSPLKFSPYIWVYPAGSSTYQSYKITGTENVIVEDLEYIPAMSVFMVRVLSGTAPGQFTITKDMQQHGAITHNLPAFTKSSSGASRAPVSSKYTDQVLFKVIPADNLSNYDLAAIGLRASASTGSDGYDMSKVYSDADIFQLYSLSSTGTKLSANGVPLNIDYVKLCFRPVSYEADFQLEAYHMETLSSEGLWLEDLKDNVIVNVFEQPSYFFTSEPGDAEDRFLVHFVKPEGSGITVPSEESGIAAYTQDDRLIVRKLTENDLGSRITVFDIAGRAVRSFDVNSYPSQNEPFISETGIYLLQMRGSRTVSVKFNAK